MILQGPYRPDLLVAETLPDILEATILRVPAAIAIQWQDQSLTYDTLGQRASLAAHHLIEAGVRPGHIVGLCLPRGADLLVMQAAIALAGAAWLPFEADTPPERMLVCLQDAGAQGLIASPDVRLDGMQTYTPWALAMPVDGPLKKREGLRPEHPAYVIYTSGSTGKPKGVPINQASICHFLRSENEVLGVRHGDKVYQGFSVAFDMSFEEIWISYLVGASLWVAPKLLTTDPEGLPDALVREGITVLHAVPTLLALFAHDVPGLRIVNLGGEVCPEFLVPRWATPGRRLFNTYGPTETTVSASLAELLPGQAVTIGVPLPNYGMLVRGEDGAVLPVGQVGELCITGPGVADGYLGRPELTAEKFLANPRPSGDHDTCMYRSGDLARIDEHGQIHCLGRSDDQVKVRGFRVELGEIEAALYRQPGVGAAAVVLRDLAGIEQLVAFLTPEGEARLDLHALRAALSRELPAYMIPARFEWVVEVPRLTSGKIDRKALRTRDLDTEARPSGEDDVPATPGQQALFDALRPLFPGQPLHLASDFFRDLGGHSLLAARLVSALRKHPKLSALSMHELYQHAGVGALAARLDALMAASPADAAPVDTEARAPEWRRWACGLAQLAVLPLLIGVRMLIWLTPFFTYHYLTGDDGDSVWRAVALSIASFLACNLLSFGVAVACKWAIVGRQKPGRYPLYGWRFYRWWLVDRILDIPPAHLLAGSPLQIWYLRALGARIGRDAAISRVSVRAPDLLTVGDGVSIGAAVNLENFAVRGGIWEVAPITLADNAYVGSYAVLQGDVSMGEGARLEGLSSLASGARVPAGQTWTGAPARHDPRAQPSDLPPRPERSGSWRRLDVLAYAAGGTLIAALFFMPVFPSFVLIDWIDARWLDLMGTRASWPYAFLCYLLLALPASALLLLLTVLACAVLRWSLLPRLSAGQWPVYGQIYLRRWLTNQIQEASLSVLHGLYASIYAGSWYRLLGAKVGRGTEISTAMGIVPDMLTLGRDSFIADGVMLGDEEIDRGWMRLRPTVVGNRSFVGNGAYVPDGSVLPDDVLIGVQSRAPANGVMASGQTWLGNPPLALPAREQTAGFPDHLTFRPSAARKLARGAVEGLRMILPLAVVIAVGYLTVMRVIPVAVNQGFVGAFDELMLAGVLYGVGTFLFLVLLKWLLMGRYRARAEPMWTPFVWKSEAVTSLYESIAVPNFFNFLRATPWLPLALRCMGARIGKRVFMDTTDITEYDCVFIGDDAVLHAGSGPQTHLFEDRVMKIGPVHIGQGVNVGPRSTILYGTHVEAGARLGPLTLVLKGETIPAGQAWMGSPATPWTD
ncbi:Pls/PosA family non-ribosomal peptide synthetase [Achromobacter piechaudii]|uniref:D-alanine--D-alanyl carrier protein ligase n=1 Tax=Achromobacter piechaudii TaxID=72556 RepID=A0ABM8L0S5_9BURK|nr:Pls/PosA family non-ribosomal peptide synthetase [Achromobacter piechaudii]CAB3720286.1 D-alanine--D-alanyl carrier protein ligase [Achromobacter piechaudii]CAB3890480.1 D-alanine--D-alanyl carrier protein ligase [Achromobacter piechaudii]CAB3951765.1 D-alanine--D-alanyl carrier protein ligase [Achromobacter piechaudii]